MASLESCQHALVGSDSGAGDGASLAAVHHECCECGGGVREHPIEDLEVVLAHVNQVFFSLAPCPPLHASLCARPCSVIGPATRCSLPCRLPSAAESECALQAEEYAMSQEKV